jgi:peroxiredoxin Q/BCP
VIGISVDSRAKNKAFAEELGVTYPILSDEDKTVSKAYGVLMPLIRLANRTTFIIDKHGTIQNVLKGSEALDPENAGQVCSLLEHRK